MRKEQEVQEVQNEQVQILHQSKNDFLKVQEAFKQEISGLRRERDGLEVRLKQLLIENQSNLEQI